MPKFPNQETASDRKPPTGIEMMERLYKGELRIPSLILEPVIDAEGPKADTSFGDGILEARWRRYKTIFLFECKSLNTPRVLANTAAHIHRAAGYRGMRPMVIVPYLSEDSINFLEREGVSGIDLCGNALVIGERFMVRRDGHPNLFTSSAPIKNVFRGTSSIFARCFLIKSRFASLNELRMFALSRAALVPSSDKKPTLAKGTASKVVQALMDDLIVAKEGAELTLLDPQRLLDSLRQNYSPYGMGGLEVKSTLSESECWERIETGVRERLAVRYDGARVGTTLRSPLHGREHYGLCERFGCRPRFAASSGNLGIP